ncbi:MAG: ABC transporter substrate-binding protein [Patescibacteria group bacterium]
MSSPSNFGLRIAAIFSAMKKSLKSFRSPRQCLKFFKLLTLKEKIFLLACVCLFIGSAIVLIRCEYIKYSQAQPAGGGVYREGLVGQPRWLNPIYAPANDVDRDVSELIFSGLVKYNAQGKIIPDLAEQYKIEESGRVFYFKLKAGLFWQDGQPLTVEDILFTVKTIQNSDYKSPLRVSFLGVETEKISDTEIRFTLKDPYPPFLETTAFKLLPKHIWENIPAEKFSLAAENLQPVGSGPFKVASLKQDKSGYVKTITLEVNPRYAGEKPFISKIQLLFYDNETGLIKAANRGEVDGFAVSATSPSFFENRFSFYRLIMPRYFAVFFNLKQSPILKDKTIRQALNYGTNKEEIVNNVLGGLGKPVESPVLPDIYNYSEPTKIYEFNPVKAKELLEKAGWTDQNNDGKVEKTVKTTAAATISKNLQKGDSGPEVSALQKCLAKDTIVYPEGTINGNFGESTKKAVIRFQEKYASDILKPAGLTDGTGTVLASTRAKLNAVCGKSPQETTPLKITLTTVNQSPLVQTAELLKQQWENIGVQVEIQKIGLGELEKDYIKKRNYESLLFGNVLASIPDPFPFWHSTQKNDPGLNLSAYEDKTSDTLLEGARKAMSGKERGQKYAKFQNALIDIAPAVFLYNPDYLYFVSKNIKGVKAGLIVDPSKRWSTISEWYIKTRRVLR